jgi:hypothetical protein
MRQMVRDKWLDRALCAFLGLSTAGIASAVVPAAALWVVADYRAVPPVSGYLSQAHVIVDEGRRTYVYAQTDRLPSLLEVYRVDGTVSVRSFSVFEPDRTLQFGRASFEEARLWHRIFDDVPQEDTP